MKKVYLDNAATTEVNPRVLEAMLPYFKKRFGNPSSIHSWGLEARKDVESARKKTASILGAKSSEIIFTSCASESINLAIKGLVEAISKGNYKSIHIISSPIEHHAGFDSVRYLEKQGAEVGWLSVDSYGFVDLDEIKKDIRPNTILISVMHVNNEVGTIEPIKEIGKMLEEINRSRRSPIFFHTDAVQAIPYLDCNVRKLKVDLLSLSGHKFHAPKGIGVLFKREGTPIVKQQNGGEQEFGLKAGTENVAYIVGLATALKLTEKNKAKTVKRVTGLRDKLIEGVLKIGGIRLTGHPKKRVPHIASFVIEGVEGEAMILLLDDLGVATSSGSACISKTLEPSHVLTALGITPQLSHGSLRLSLSSKTTEEDIAYVLKVLPKVISHLRKMAPKLK